MALRGTLTHRKTRRLAQKLGIDPCFALGIVESLWDVTSRQSQNGDIGKMSNADIAMEMFYSGDPDVLVEALIYAGFIEESSEHRLIIHDWHIHSDDATDNRIARSGGRYANGAQPRMRKLPTAERAKLCAQYGYDEHSTCARVSTDEHKKLLTSNQKPVTSNQKPDLKTNTNTPTPTAPVDEFLFAWNENHGDLPAVRELTKSRKQKLAVRVKQGLTCESFTEAVRLASRTPFCRGENDRHWKLDFDFLIENDTNLTKVLEGKYGPPDKPKPVYREMTDEEAAAAWKRDFGVM